MWVTFAEGEPSAMSVRECLVEVRSGPDEGERQQLAKDVIRIGAKRGNDLVLSDRRVSGFHLEIRPDDRGYRIRDLESTNGTFVYGVRIADAYLQGPTTIKVGRTELSFEPLSSSVDVPLYSENEFAGLVGGSPGMRRIFHQLEKIAPSTATVLVTGETGVGKELIAEAVHDTSSRRDGPFVIVDCGAIPENLFENELFGHERGAFTGATGAMAGAFERAHGGTLFLDEIGELPLSLQPKLLRVVQAKRVRRIGGDKMIDCDVRIVAATNRDLPLEINRGRFREDLYYRLAVAGIHVPPLRERREDIPLLAARFAAELPGGSDAPLPPTLTAAFEAHDWPGNVRELRNAIERAVLLPQYPPGLQRAQTANSTGPRVNRAVDVDIPFKVAKREFVDEFDRVFMTELLERHDWNIAAAARATGLDRVSIYKLLNRLGIEREHK